MVKAGYKQTEIGVIPEDWNVETLENIADRNIKWSLTGGPFGSNLKSSDYTNDGIRIIQLQNIGDGEFHNNYEIYTSIEKANELLSCNIYPNEIILSKMGDPVARACIIPDYHKRYLMCSDGIRLVVDKKNFDSKYIFYFINSNKFRNNAENSSTGTTRKRIGLTELKNLQLVIPSKKEQKAIANALSDVDALITSLEKLIAKKESIKTATMQQLLTGKKRLNGFSGKWEEKKLGEIAHISRGASPRPIESPKWFDNNSSVGWVRISDISKTTKFLNQTVQKLSLEGISQSRFVQKENLIMSICATIGKPILTKLDTCIHDGFVVFNNLKIDREFLYYFLLLIEQNWSKSGQTGSQMNLNTELINSTIILLPPTHDEQQAIAQILSDMDNEIEALKTKLSKTKAMKDGMMSELLSGKTRLKV